jgi:hypothetical protein
MQPYQNLGGESGILAYEIGPDSITVQFKDGHFRFYLYTYTSTGTSEVETMKRLAAKGAGLNSYIMTTVKQNFARKW